MCGFFTTAHLYNTSIGIAYRTPVVCNLQFAIGKIYIYKTVLNYELYN